MEHIGRLGNYERYLFLHHAQINLRNALMNYAAVDAHRGIARGFERDALGAPHANALVAEEAVGEEIGRAHV